MGAGEASRLGNPAATTDRPPRPPISQTALANDVNDYGVVRLYATQADNNCSSMRMMESTLSRLTNSGSPLPNSIALSIVL